MDENSSGPPNSNESQQARESGPGDLLEILFFQLALTGKTLQLLLPCDQPGELDKVLCIKENLVQVSHPIHGPPDLQQIGQILERCLGSIAY